MSRGRFIGALAALGVSMSAVEGMTQETMAELIDNPKEEVPRIMGCNLKNFEEVKMGLNQITNRFITRFLVIDGNALMLPTMHVDR